jgi:hypothetical protein
MNQFETCLDVLEGKSISAPEETACIPCFKKELLGERRNGFMNGHTYTNAALSRLVRHIDVLKEARGD